MGQILSIILRFLHSNGGSKARDHTPRDHHHDHDHDHDQLKEQILPIQSQQPGESHRIDIIDPEPLWGSISTGSYNGTENDTKPWMMLDLSGDQDQLVGEGDFSGCDQDQLGVDFETVWFDHIVDKGVKRIGPYKSTQSIQLVGEGDFSGCDQDQLDHDFETISVLHSNGGSKAKDHHHDHDHDHDQLKKQILPIQSQQPGESHGIDIIDLEPLWGTISTGSYNGTENDTKPWMILDLSDDQDQLDHDVESVVPFDHIVDKVQVVVEEKVHEGVKRIGPYTSTRSIQLVGEGDFSGCDQDQLDHDVESVVRFDHIVDKGVKRIGPYKSTQSILLVGEGDFSFSASLAVVFGSASNIVATSLNTEDFLNSNYGNFPNNKMELVSRGSVVLHGIDATSMTKHHRLRKIKFDRIIYNFPHSGFDRDTRKAEIRRHQKLVSGFLRNAKKMMKKDGEIHVTHKSNGYFLEWNIPKLGSEQGLNLIQEVKFKRSKYPGYHTKYGFGGDKDFDCNPSKTYKFAQLITC